MAACWGWAGQGTRSGPKPKVFVIFRELLLLYPKISRGLLRRTQLDMVTMFKHKIDPSSPVHTVLIVMRDYAAGSIIMQFDMPDPTPVAEGCGILRCEH
jgi:hypothetical protein